MKPITLVLALAAAVLLTSPARTQEEGKAPEPTDRVKDLQKQRIEVLTQAAQAGFRLAQTSRLDVGVAVEDRMALLRAELEGISRNTDRIPLYTKAVASLKEYEEVARAQYEHGRLSEHSLLKVRARRLEAEIALENAKAQGGRGGR